MGEKKSATVRTSDVRPRRPRVDRGEEIEHLVRQMFKSTVERWCKDNLDKDAQPDKEVKGNVVDNLTAQFTSAIETLVDAATDSYLSTASDEEECDEVECPECEEVFELEPDEDGNVPDEGDEVSCPKCKHTFEVPPIVEEGEEASGS